MKSFKQYIKENTNYSDIDPLGEEDWDDENDTPIITFAKKLCKPLDQITELDCSENQLTSLEGIEKLVNLERLDCSYNQLTSLKGIENLTNLKTLICDNNQLTILEGIRNLVNLEELGCFGNRLTSLEGIENLTNLNYLSCWNNRFSNKYEKYLRSLKIKNSYIV